MALGVPLGLRERKSYRCDCRNELGAAASNNHLADFHCIKSLTRWSRQVSHLRYRAESLDEASSRLMQPGPIDLPNLGINGTEDKIACTVRGRSRLRFEEQKG